MFLKRMTACLVICVLGSVVCPLAGASAAVSTQRTRDYPLPSDGWKPGEPGFTALLFGRFYATHTASGACAWIGSPDHPENYLWPAGYRVRFHPVELLDPTGKVVAHQGQEVNAGGGSGYSATWVLHNLGSTAAASLHCCQHGAKGSAVIQSSVRAG